MSETFQSPDEDLLELLIRTAGYAKQLQQKDASALRGALLGFLGRVQARWPLVYPQNRPERVRELIKFVGSHLQGQVHDGADSLFEGLRAMKDRDLATACASAHGYGDTRAAPSVVKHEITSNGLRVLHLSDLHFTQDSQWDSAPVLYRLSQDVRRQWERGHGPDLIIITGDIAFSGKREEYDLARKWLLESLLPAARLTTQQLIIVPGNHDVDRCKISRCVTALQRELLHARNQAELRQMLANAADRDILLARHEAFLYFLNELQIGGRPWTVPWGAIKLTVRGVRIHVAALCSSWLSTGNTDKGSLLLGLHQVNEALQGCEDAELTLTAMHHPFEYCADLDRASRREVCRSSPLILRGHLHEAECVLQQGPRQEQIIEIAAGASYECSECVNAYQTVSVDLATSQVRVQTHSWDMLSRGWTANMDGAGEESNTFPLRRRRS